MKFCFSLLLLSVCTTVMGMAFNGGRTGVSEIESRRLFEGGKYARLKRHTRQAEWSFRKAEDTLGLEDSKSQLGEEKYKKLIDSVKEYVNGLKSLPNKIFSGISDNVKKAQEVMENKVIQPLTGHIRDFVNGVKQLGENAGEKPAADGKPATK
ncbi:uncharacterized protein LOC123008881 [Tribolium madens]|uniref:uncharacterized protein LOC123008881 n=1 Tax=Tribolium madens TaxID=41895 RepID=UPI001CF72B57|nr:uncharacterized protein LOC123008881 [Tribolium madens]